MSKHIKRKTTWLLTVASAYAVLPGCGDDADDRRSDAAQTAPDAGLLIRPDAGNIDAGNPLVPGLDAGSVFRPPSEAGADSQTEDGARPVIQVGVVVRPPSGPPDDGGVEEPWIGLLIHPPVES